MATVAYSPMYNDMKTGRWYYPYLGGGGRAGDQGSVLNAAFAIPMVTGPQTLGITQMGVVASAAATTHLKVSLAIYSATSATDATPKTLVVDSGTIDVTGAGLITCTAFTEVFLSPWTLYYMCSKREQAATVASGKTIAMFDTQFYGAKVGSATPDRDFENGPISKSSPTVGAWPGTFYSPTVFTNNATFTVLPYFLLNSVS